MENKIKNQGRRKYFCNSDAFLKENALSFYLLGCFCTDGNIYYQRHGNSWRISFVSKDFDWISEIAKIICSTLPIKVNKRSKCYFIEFSDEKIKNWLIDHGCTPKKSLTLEVKNIPKQYFFDFFRGAVDGDGTIMIDRKKSKETSIQCKIAIYSASKSFIDQIKNELEKENITSNIYKREAKKQNIMGQICETQDFYSLYINKSDIVKSLKLMYNTENCISLKRKKNNAIEILTKCQQEETEKENKKEEFRELIKDKSYQELMNELNLTKEAIWHKCKKINQFPGKETFGHVTWVNDEELINLLKTIGHKKTMEKLGIINNKTIPSRLKKIGITLEQIINPNKKVNFRKEKVNWPNDDELLSMVKENNFAFAAKKIGVKGDTIKLRLLKAGLIDENFKGAKSQGYGMRNKTKAKLNNL